ncbi:MAG: CBS domain-containing protein, partial [Gammaproteobacteria bacterium]|nr:CBS domain-containing protein [Gammaproteobacteria bacterium]
MTDDHPPSSNGSAAPNWLRRLLHQLAGEPRDRDELLELLREAQKRDLFDQDAQRMLEGVLHVAESQVRDIMVPRAHMVVVERDAEPSDLLQTIVESGHSRFPVVGENRDEVAGILLAKDLLRFFAENGQARFDIRECLRPAVFIPESKRLNVLLKEFRANRNHMAVVVDEYGGVSGLITIEDVIEQIVGDIDDEHDIVEDVYIQREGDSRFRVRALTRIEDFNDYFDCELSDEEYDTIGGLIMHE